MAQSSCTVLPGAKTSLSAEEVQRKLHQWFEEQGLLSDLRAHIRQLMIAALKGTQLGPQAGHSMHQNTSPKIQAINLLVAEFLLLQECHYTLSVFTSEVPLLRNLPEFSPSFKDAAKNKLSTKKSGDVKASPSRLQERHVWDILEALGFPPDSSAGNAVFKSYQENIGEPLLTCLIRSVAKVIRCERRNEKKLKTEDSISISDNDSSLLIDENSDKENDKNDQKVSFHGMPVVHEILQRLNVKPKYTRKLENEIKRLIKATQLAEQEYFHEKLLSHEKRIQEERAHYEKELYSQIMQAQKQLVGQSATAETGLRSLETQVMAAIEKLQRNLRLVEERDRDKRKEHEKLRQKMKKKELDLPEEKNEILDNSQQKISNKPADKLAKVPSVQQMESHNDSGKRPVEKSYCVSEDNRNDGQVQVTQTPSKLQQESSVSSRDQSVQAGKPGWQVINDFEEVRATVQRLQQENEELRNLMLQQQVQVSELRTLGQVHLATSVSCSPALTQLVASAESIASVPPPLPPRAPQQRVLFPPADEELHFCATGETCVAPASTQTPRNVRSRARRLRRFPTPRQVFPSSEETSPTEEMLRDARRRLRELEEESEAVDRSYREFCLRQQRAIPVSDVLADLLQSPNETECPLNNSASATDATGDTLGFKLPRPFLVTCGNFSADSQHTAVTITETEVTHIVSEAQNTVVHHTTRPTVTQNSNVCLSDLIYNIPSSDIVSQQSILINDRSISNVIAETHTDSYQTAKMQAQSEVHTTHFYRTPLLSSSIGMASSNAGRCTNSVTMENLDSACGYNKHKNKSLNSAKMHSDNEGSTNVPEKTNVRYQRFYAPVGVSDPLATKKTLDKTVSTARQTKVTAEAINLSAKGPECSNLVTHLNKCHKTLKDSEQAKKETERRIMDLPDDNENPKLYEQRPLKTLVLSDVAEKPHSTQTVEKRSEGNKEVLYQTSIKNGDKQQKDLQYSLNATDLSHPRLSDIILVQESSEELQDEIPTNDMEKDSKKYLTLHNLSKIDSERSSLGDAEFIAASSGDQLFVPSCNTDTETEPGTSKSDMLLINEHQNHPVYETEEQAPSNRSISSEQPISAGKSVSSGGNDFW